MVEPGTPLVWNWHIDAICAHLEAFIPVERRQAFASHDKALIFIRWLIINIPPGHMKSLLLAVFFPAWVWTFWPEWRGIFGSYFMPLALRDSVRCRDVILSDKYQEWFQPHWDLKSDQNLKGYFANTRGGLRQCVSVGSGSTGFRGDGVFIDDPLSAKEAYSEAARQEAIYWVDKVMSSRLNDPRSGVRGVMMQRLHEEDPSGHLLARGGWEHLCLPSELDSSRRCETALGFVDPRENDGDLLFPEFFTPEVLAQARKDLGEADYAGQHLQRPHPSEGIILRPRFLKYWVPKGSTLAPPKWKDEEGNWHESEVVELPDFSSLSQSWDMSFKKTVGSDLVAGGVWGKKDAVCYLIDLVWEKLSFTQTCRAVEDLKAKHPKTRAIWIEDKANGPAVIDTLSSKIPGLIPVNPEGGKESRAHATSPFLESGNIVFPHPSLAPWIAKALAEMTAFPHGKHDDFVDQLTQAIIQMLANTAYTWDF